MSPVRAGTRGQSYWQASRSHRYSLLFALPLLLGYEALAVGLSDARTGGVRNGADVLLRGAFDLVAGRWGTIAFGVTVIGVSLWLVWRDVRAHGWGIRWGVFLGMLLEATALALVFGLVVGLVTARILHPLAPLALAPTHGIDRTTEFMVSLGAGLYEELLFRVVLVSAFAWGAERVLGAGKLGAGIIAAIASALIFSAFHYIGPYGDVLQLRSFVYRAVAGLAFSGLYLLRGFGITAWTHALYDVFLLL